MPKYIPVSCELHSELELVIMKQQWLMLTLTNSTTLFSTTSLRVQPKDIYTKDKSEFLKAQDKNGHIFDIRLDTIAEFRLLSSL